MPLNEVNYIMSDSTEITQTTESFSLASLPPELQAKLLAASEQLKNSAAITVNKIRNDAKSFIFPDGTETQKFAGIIIAVKHANMHYASEYVEGKSNPPDCIAIAEGEIDPSNNDLVPHNDVVAPHIVGGFCGKCPKLQWGSDKGGKGKGKECSEYVLLAINVPALGDEIFLLECKKGNVKTVNGYLANVRTKFGHPIAVLTQFTTGTKIKWAHEYATVSPVSVDLVTNLAGRMEEANNMLIARVVDAYKRGVATEIPFEDTTAGRTPRER